MATATKKPTIQGARQSLIEEAVQALDIAREKLQELFDDLEEKRANMEERFSGTERYTRFEDACSTLEEVISNIETAQNDAQIELP